MMMMMMMMMMIMKRVEAVSFGGKIGERKRLTKLKHKPMPHSLPDTTLHRVGRLLIFFFAFILSFLVASQISVSSYPDCKTLNLSLSDTIYPIIK
jgi:hypothetical protein